MCSGARHRLRVIFCSTDTAQIRGEGAAGCMCVCLFPGASWWRCCELGSVGWRCDSQAGLFGLSSGPKNKGMETEIAHNCIEMFTLFF